MPCVPGSNVAIAPPEAPSPRPLRRLARCRPRSRRSSSRSRAGRPRGSSPTAESCSARRRPGVAAAPSPCTGRCGTRSRGPRRRRPSPRSLARSRPPGQPRGAGWNGLGQDLRGGLRWHLRRRWRWGRGRARRLGDRVGTDDISADRPVDERRSGADARPHSQDGSTRRARCAGQGDLRGAITRGARNPEAEADLARAGHHHPTRPSTDAQRAVATARRNDRPKDHSLARANTPAQGVRLGGLRGGHGQAKRRENGRRPSPSAARRKHVVCRTGEEENAGPVAT